MATVRAPASVTLKVFTVRGTAFDKAPSTEDGVDVLEIEAVAVPVEEDTTVHLKTSITQSDRPELGSARKVVSGGRALKSAETFAGTIHPLADVLGAAVGASRAAVDAGYADNSLQVCRHGLGVKRGAYERVGVGRSDWEDRCAGVVRRSWD